MAKQPRQPVHKQQMLIVLLAGLSVLLTLGAGLWIAYRIQRELLVQNTLESNRVYARKLAESTDQYLGVASRLLQAQGPELMRHWHDPDQIEVDLRHLRSEFDGFNAVAVVDARARMLAMSPRVLARDTLLNSIGSRQALQQRKVLVSPPYRSSSGRLVVVISSPVFAADSRYLGYVAGVIYLQQDNILHDLLGEHYYQDGSNLYVVDGARQLIYHHDAQRIGQTVGANPAIDRVLAGEAGSMKLVNSQGEKMLAGFAPMHRTDWGVVAQRPLAVTLAPLQNLVWRALGYMLPVLAIVLLLIWWQARVIRMLSRMSCTIRQLNIETHTDPLTGLLNRRGMQEVLDRWGLEQRAFAVILLDLDHFKQINDVHGHDGGDQVLKAFGNLMRQQLRPGDVACRRGGEEFTVLLADATLAQAGQVAERLRQRMVAQPLAGLAVTASLGVAHYPSTSPQLEEVLKRADAALYQAKAEGRNRVKSA